MKVDPINQASIQVNLGKWDKAVHDLEKAVKENPRDPNLYNLLGLLNFKVRGNFSEAEVFFKKAIGIDEKFEDTYVNYTGLLRSAGKYAAIPRVLAMALEHTNLNRARIYYEMAEAHELLEKYDEAIEHFKQSARFSESENVMQTIEKAINRCSQKKGLLLVA